jgi:hypothetical protein
VDDAQRSRPAAFTMEQTAFTMEQTAFTMEQTAFTMEQTARMVGAWAWAEGCLYEVLGGWVASASAPSTKVYFDSTSLHHAWRAQLWQERLPARLVPAPARPGPGLAEQADSTPPPHADLVRPPSDGAEAAMKALSNLEGDAGRLAAYCRVVLARTAVAYRDWQKRCSPSSDRPVARVLGIALADVLSDWQDGCRLLVEVFGSGGGGQVVEDAASASADIERLLVPPVVAPVGEGPVPRA